MNADRQRFSWIGHLAFVAYRAGWKARITSQGSPERDEQLIRDGWEQHGGNRIEYWRAVAEAVIDEHDRRPPAPDSSEETP